MRTCQRPPLHTRACPTHTPLQQVVLRHHAHSVSPRGRAGHRPEHVHVPLHHPQGAQRLRQQSCVCRGRLRSHAPGGFPARTQGLHDLAPILGVSNVQNHVNRAMTVSGLWGGGGRREGCVCAFVLHPLNLATPATLAVRSCAAVQALRTAEAQPIPVLTPVSFEQGDVSYEDPHASPPPPSACHPPRAPRCRAPRCAPCSLSPTLGGEGALLPAHPPT